MIQEILKYVAIAVLSAWGGNRLAIFQKAAERRREFRDKVRLLAAGREYRWTGDPAFSSLAIDRELKEACVKIRDDIPRWRRRRFDDTFDSLFGPFSNRAPSEGLYGTEYIEANAKDSKRGRAAIDSLLRCAK
jgi:hypothetical protein